MSKDTEQQLFEIKEKIDQAKESVSRLEGRRDHLLNQLEEQWECESVEEAESLLEEHNKEINDLEQKIDKGVKKLEKDYELNQES